MEKLECFDPETGEIISLTDENLDYLNKLVEYYLNETNSHIDVLKEISLNLMQLTLAQQTREQILNYVKLNLGIVNK